MAALLAVAALATGYLLGSRRSRRSRRTLKRDLATRSLQVLAARAEQTRLLARLDEVPRRERLLRLLMARLRDSRARERDLERALAAARADGTFTTHGCEPDHGGQPVTVGAIDRKARDACRDAPLAGGPSRAESARPRSSRAARSEATPAPSRPGGTIARMPAPAPQLELPRSGTHRGLVHGLALGDRRRERLRARPRPPEHPAAHREFASRRGAGTGERGGRRRRRRRSRCRALRRACAGRRSRGARRCRGRRARGTRRPGRAAG